MPPDVNPYGTAGEPAYGTTNPPPAAPAATPVTATAAPPPGASDPEVAEADKAVAAAQALADQAQREYQDAATAFDKLMASPSAAFDTSGGVKAAASRVDAAQRALAEARGRVADANTRTAVAAQNAAARLQSSRNNDPALQNYYNAHADQAKASADLATAQAKAQEAKTPVEIAQAQAAIQEATARAQSLGVLTPAQANQANAAALESNARAANVSALTPVQVRQGTAAAANTETQTQLLIPAQAKQALAAAGYSDAEAENLLRKTPAEIDALVAQGHLSQANADLVKANIPKVGAETAQTEAQTNLIQQGALAGINEQIAVLRDQIASGNLSPEEANQKIQDLLSARIQQSITGATQFQRQNAALDAETARRQQDATLAGSQASSFGSGFSSGLSTFQKLNDTTPVGSDSAGRGFLASMSMLADRLRSFTPSMPASSPLLQSLAAGPAPSASPTVSPAAPDTNSGTNGNGHTITINIGGAGGSATATQTPDAAQPMAPAQDAAGGAGLDWLRNSPSSPMQNQNNLPEFLRNQQPATPSDLAALWADDPHLNSTVGIGGGAREE